MSQEEMPRKTDTWTIDERIACAEHSIKCGAATATTYAQLIDAKLDLVLTKLETITTQSKEQPTHDN